MPLLYLFYLVSTIEPDVPKINRRIAEEIQVLYTHANSIFVHENVSTRGYSNLLFGRGIYEFKSLDSGKTIAREKNKQFIVMFQCEKAAWNLYDYRNYYVYDMLNDRYIKGITP
jgi:hypothetical protein